MGMEEESVAQYTFSASVSPGMNFNVATTSTPASSAHVDARKRNRTTSRDHNHESNIAKSKATKDAENLFMLSISPGFNV